MPWKYKLRIQERKPLQRKIYCGTYLDDRFETTNWFFLYVGNGQL